MVGPKEKKPRRESLGNGYIVRKTLVVQEKKKLESRRGKCLTTGQSKKRADTERKNKEQDRGETKGAKRGGKKALKV